LNAEIRFIVICVIWRKIRHERKMSMLTSVQVRIARAALGWSVADLANQSGVSARTINRIEVEGGAKVATKANLKLIRETLEAAGVEFVGGPGDGPGVRLWK
jgi:transcriptional regulator with XRE-family HTH domain